MQVPYLKLEYSENVLAEAARATDDDSYINGKSNTLFEAEFKKALNANFCLSTANGTDSLFIALKCLGIQPGDEVITPAFSWISSSETISLCFAKPVFVDIDPQTYTLDPKRIEEKITSKTKAIIVVHLYGQAAHISDIRTICKKHKLALIEDCAQAQLTYEGSQCVGTFGDAGAFSFYPTKNLGAYGDAGCIVTNNNELAERMRRFANHGALHKDDHLIEGTNSRMDTLQAAVLLAKLSHLQEGNEQRRRNATRYNDRLTDLKSVVTPYVRPGTTPSFHIYAIRAERRDDLQAYLKSQGIQTLIHYPQSLPNLPAYKHLGHTPHDFPVSSTLQKETLSLPIYPGLTPDQIEYVCSSIHAFYH